MQGYLFALRYLNKEMACRHGKAASIALVVASSLAVAACEKPTTGDIVFDDYDTMPQCDTIVSQQDNTLQVLPEVQPKPQD